MKCSFALFSTLILSPGQVSPVSARTYTCDRTKNFIPGASYGQLSLTDGCKYGVCDANPKYGAPNDPEKAILYCQDVCDERADCRGFFFQVHGNGHELCGFFAAEVDDGRASDGNGAVCLPALDPPSPPRGDGPCGGRGVNRAGCCGDEAKNCFGECLPPKERTQGDTDCELGLVMECAARLLPGTRYDWRYPIKYSGCPNQLARFKACTVDFQSYNCYGATCGDGELEPSCDGFVCETADERCVAAADSVDMSCEEGTACHANTRDLRMLCEGGAECSTSPVANGKVTCLDGASCTSSTATGDDQLTMICQAGSTCVGKASTGSATTVMICDSGSTCTCSAGTGSAECVMRCDEGAECSCSRSTGASKCVWVE